MSDPREIYRSKLVDADAAVAAIRPNDFVVLGMWAAEPLALTWALANRVRDGGLSPIRLYAVATTDALLDSILAPDLADAVHHLTTFVGTQDRRFAQVGLSQYLPAHLHQVPRLLTEAIGVDAALASVAPMDDEGFFSLGPANDFILTSLRRAGRAIVEVNSFTPRVGGDSRIHVSDVAAIVECDNPDQASAPAVPSAQDDAIADAIAGQVPEHATLQIGVGIVPDLVCDRLSGRRDLGIHTEMLSEGLVRLVRAGAVTGAHKTLHPGKHVFTLAPGTETIAEALASNPDYESYPSSYTNHPSTIAKNERMVSVNAILEIDLLGQANAEFLAGHQYSGSGGQLDFVRGAYDAPGGQSFLAFHATARDGSVSRIVPRLPAGSMVTTPRNDTHLVVTEFGVADLKGKTMDERAEALIALADPRFREELRCAAGDMGLF